MRPPKTRIVVNMSLKSIHEYTFELDSKAILTIVLWIATCIIQLATLKSDLLQFSIQSNNIKKSNRRTLNAYGQVNSLFYDL